MQGEKPAFIYDRRRRHRHYQATIVYRDGGEFSRVYLDKERAEKFIARQKKSPIVADGLLREVD